MVQEEEMRVDLGVIKRHCEPSDCRTCVLRSTRTGQFCLFSVPPVIWDTEAIERRYNQIVTDKARAAIEGRMGE